MAAPILARAMFVRRSGKMSQHSETKYSLATKFLQGGKCGAAALFLGHFLINQTKEYREAVNA